MIEEQERRYKNGEKCVTAFTLIGLIKPLKNDGQHNWLYEVSNKSLQRICHDLAFSYKRFFNGIDRHPKFKSKKKSKTAYPTSSEYFYFQNDSVLNIEKVGKVKYKTDFSFAYGLRAEKYKNVRVSYKNGKWFVSFSVECESQAQKLTEVNMGIDLGIKTTATVEFNGKQIVYHNINKSKKVKFLEKKLAHINKI